MDASAIQTNVVGSPARVLIAGAGVAGLETVLALRALAGDGVEITLLSSDPKFVNRSMSVDQPFRPQRVRGIRLDTAVPELGAHWHHGTLDRVDADRHRAITRDGCTIPYDRLVIAIGARTDRGWEMPGVLTYQGGNTGSAYRELLHRLHTSTGSRVAFVKQAGPSWPLPLYDLALMTAADCLAHGLSDVELSLITPEDEPLEIFGRAVSASVRELLEENAITLHASTYATPSWRGWLHLSPGDRSLRVDRIVTQPRLIGPRLRGIPCDRDGFIKTDLHGRAEGLDDVFSAGDATAFPVKQGGLAAQQADAVAESIAQSIGIDIEPVPFRPILRGVLLTGKSPRYLRTDISGRAGENSTISDEPLWQPPVKLGGRFLAEYLSIQTGSAADVMSTPEAAHELVDLAPPSLRRAPERTHS